MKKSQIFIAVGLATVMAASMLFVHIPRAYAGFIDGGTSQGGGGVVDPRELTMEEIADSVAESRQIIFYFLFLMESRHRLAHRNKCKQKNTVSCRAEKKLFSREKDVYKTLLDAKIVFEKNRPCFDWEGNPKDGSVANVRPGNICISGKNLKEKLTAFSFKSQITALVFHELSHLMGANKEEAEHLQMLLLHQFERYLIRDLVQKGRAMISEVYPLIGMLHYFEFANKSKIEDAMRQFCGAEKFLSSAVENINNNHSTLYTFQMASDENAIYFSEAVIQAGAIADFYCTIFAQRSLNHNRHDLLEKYDDEIKLAKKRLHRLQRNKLMRHKDYYDSRKMSLPLWRILRNKYTIKRFMQSVHINNLKEREKALSRRVDFLKREFEKIQSGRFRINYSIGREAS